MFVGGSLGSNLDEVVGTEVKRTDGNELRIILGLLLGRELSLADGKALWL